MWQFASTFVRNLTLKRILHLLARIERYESDIWSVFTPLHAAPSFAILIVFHTTSFRSIECADDCIMDGISCRQFRPSLNIEIQ